MDRRIRFKEQGTTRDAYGETDTTYSNLSDTDATLGNVWAEVVYPGSAKESERGQSLFPERDLSFVIRHPRGSWTPTEAMRVEYDGDTFDVIGIQEIGRRDGLRIFCKMLR